MTRASPSNILSLQLHSLAFPLPRFPPTESMAAAVSLGLFNPPPTLKTPTLKPAKPATLLLHHSHNDLNFLHSSASGISIAAASAAAFLLPEFLIPPEALSAGGEFGILEGRTLALVHPLVMGSLFIYTLWTGYLGWQWRRVRTIQDEINDLKKQVKSPDPAAAAASGAVGAYKESVPPPQEAPSPIELNILKLTEERKQLLKGGYRDRHFNAGSILLGFGVLEAVGGALNTWLRTGKLFPGPHLFAGAGITVLWALAAALVPPMQKGNETARNLHIALNAVNVLLFLSQIPTGIEILLKVFEFTQWP